jgi:hypothetical protein
MCDGFPVSADARADVVVHLGPRGTPDAERGSEHAMATFAVEPGRPHEGVVRDVKRYVWSSL